MPKPDPTRCDRSDCRRRGDHQAVPNGPRWCGVHCEICPSWESLGGAPMPIEPSRRAYPDRVAFAPPWSHRWVHAIRDRHNVLRVVVGDDVSSRPRPIVVAQFRTDDGDDSAARRHMAELLKIQADGGTWDDVLARAGHPKEMGKVSPPHDLKFADVSAAYQIGGDATSYPEFVHAVMTAQQQQPTMTVPKVALIGVHQRLSVYMEDLLQAIAMGATEIPVSDVQRMYSWMSMLDADDEARALWGDDGPPIPKWDEVPFVVLDPETTPKGFIIDMPRSAAPFGIRPSSSPDLFGRRTIRARPQGDIGEIGEIYAMKETTMTTTSTYCPECREPWKASTPSPHYACTNEWHTTTTEDEAAPAIETDLHRQEIWALIGPGGKPIVSGVTFAEASGRLPDNAIGGPMLGTLTRLMLWDGHEYVLTAELPAEIAPPTHDPSLPPVTDHWLGQYEAGLATTVVRVDEDGPILNGVSMHVLLETAATAAGNLTGYDHMDLEQSLISEVRRLRQVAEHFGAPANLLGRS